MIEEIVDYVSWSVSNMTYSLTEKYKDAKRKVLGPTTNDLLWTVNDIWRADKPKRGKNQIYSLEIDVNDMMNYVSTLHPIRGENCFFPVICDEPSDERVWYTRDTKYFYNFVIRADLGTINGFFRYSPISYTVVRPDYVCLLQYIPARIVGLYSVRGRDDAEKFYMDNIFEINDIIIKGQEMLDDNQ